MNRDKSSDETVTDKYLKTDSEGRDKSSDRDSYRQTPQDRL